MRKKKNISGIAAAFGVSAVWFGTHVGGGFATGNQTVRYFVRFGWTTVFIPALTMILMGWCYYQAVVMADNYDAHRYHDLARVLYSPFSKFGILFFDIAYFVLVLVGTGIAIAGAGSLFNELWGLNYYIGILLTGLVFFLLTIFGAQLVRRAASVVTILILACLLILLIPGISSGWGNASTIISQKARFGSWFDLIWSALLYGGFQILVVPSLISTSQELTTKSSQVSFAIIGTILNGLMITLSAIMLLGYMPELESNALPIFTIAEKLGNTALLNSYSAILFLAFVSTGVGLIFGMVTRFEDVIFKKQKLQVRRSLISFLCIFLAVILSMAGLTKLIAVGYGWIGRISIFLLVIPLAIFAPIKNAKFRKAGKE